MRKQQSGFTLIELIVVMVVVGLLAAVAVPKFLDVSKKAEAAAVKNVLGSLRSALSLKVASGLVNGDDVGSWVYNGSAALNPMQDLLAEKPENYRGILTTNGTNDDQGFWWDRERNARDHWVMYKLKDTSIISSGGFNSVGTNIIHRIDSVPVSDTDNTLAGLALDTTTTYQYTWAE